MGQAAGCMGLRREFCGGRTAGGAVGGDGIRIWNLGAGGVARGKGSRKESADSTVLRPFAASFQVSDLRAAPPGGHMGSRSRFCCAAQRAQCTGF